jgi:predicted RNA-binding protein associated with RNAse of E/G family
VFFGGFPPLAFCSLSLPSFIFSVQDYELTYSRDEENQSDRVYPDVGLKEARNRRAAHNPTFE